MPVFDKPHRATVVHDFTYGFRRKHDQSCYMIFYIIKLELFFAPLCNSIHMRLIHFRYIPRCSSHRFLMRHTSRLAQPCVSNVHIFHTTSSTATQHICISELHIHTTNSLHLPFLCPLYHFLCVSRRAHQWRPHAHISPFLQCHTIL